MKYETPLTETDDKPFNPDAFESQVERKDKLKESIRRDIIYCSEDTLNEALNVIQLPSRYRVYNADDEVTISRTVYEKILTDHPQYLI